MKLTWFGGTAFRLHVGGLVLVVDPQTAGDRVEPAELLSGADRVLRLDDPLPIADGARWQPRRVPALIDDEGVAEVDLERLGPGAVLIAALGEPPLVLASAGGFAAGRWGRDAIVLLCGEIEEATARAVLQSFAPRLLIAAADDERIERLVPAIRESLAGTGFFAMEPGLALEV